MSGLPIYLNYIPRALYGIGKAAREAWQRRENSFDWRGQTYRVTPQFSGRPTLHRLLINQADGTPMIRIWMNP